VSNTLQIECISKRKGKILKEVGIGARSNSLPVCLLGPCYFQPQVTDFGGAEVYSGAIQVRVVSVEVGLVKVVGDQLARVVPPTLTGTVMLWVPNMAGVIPLLIN
jgi:hypothetical protein